MSVFRSCFCLMHLLGQWFSAEIVWPGYRRHYKEVVLVYLGYSNKNTVDLVA